jgi:alkylation response protein AidB-like acyl-CoA dehydrogenase
VLVPEEYGGTGLNWRAMSALLEETSAQLIAEPLTSAAVLAGGVLAHADESALKRSLLQGLISGNALPALAWQENLNDVDGLLPNARLLPHEGGFRLSGRKVLVAGAGAAAGFIVTCRCANDLVLVWVSASDTNPEIQWRADGAPSMELRLDEITVASRQILADGPRAADALRMALNATTVLICAELVGLMRRALEITLDYLRIREQYGRRIGSFQALQHKAVDLFVQQELSAAVMEEAVTALSQDAISIEMTRLASRAKARCSDAALRITREAIQLHGAIGYTDEYDLGLYLKRALVLSAWMGNASQHRTRFARLRDGNS